MTIGAYAYYNNDASHNATYGKLYNWYAVNTGKLCPNSWHILTEDEWIQLENYLGGSSVAGGKMKATTLWASPNTGVTNESGFSGLPSWHRLPNGTYSSMGGLGYWWSSTEYNTYNAWLRYLYYYYSDVIRYNNNKYYGFSCRCVKD